ncbi:MAG: hypothetical protein ACTSYR_03985 [Candidatus Odinarchaeia archaeon]
MNTKEKLEKALRVIQKTNNKIIITDMCVVIKKCYLSVDRTLDTACCHNEELQQAFTEQHNKTLDEVVDMLGEQEVYATVNGMTSILYFDVLDAINNLRIGKD